MFLVNNDFDFLLSKTALLGFVSQETALPFFAGHTLGVNIHRNIIDTYEVLLAFCAVGLTLNNRASIAIVNSAALDALSTTLADGPSGFASLADHFTLVIFQVVLAVFNLVDCLASWDTLEVILTEVVVLLAPVAEFLALVGEGVSGLPEAVFGLVTLDAYSCSEFVFFDEESLVAYGASVGGVHGVNLIQLAVVNFHTDVVLAD